MRLGPALVLFTALTARLAAQPSFDVASLKPSAPAGDTYSANLGTARNGEVRLSNATLADCIKFAYGLVSDVQLTGPDWIGSKEIRFDVIGKAPAATPRDELLMMLCALLDERFRLRMHLESKILGHYVLSVSPNGLRMPAVESPATPPSMTYATGRIVHPAIPVQTLALLLSRQTRELILDDTQLKGYYRVQLEWTPENAPPDSHAAAPTLFTALQEQLGLKLVLRKDPVAIRVVDFAEKVPLAN